MDFSNDKVVLLKFKSETMGSAAEYERFSLDDVMVRETFADDAEAVNDGGAVVYFLNNVSICRDADGRTVSLPRIAKGDLCLLHSGSADEMTMRIAEAGYFTGGSLAHVRLKLK